MYCLLADVQWDQFLVMIAPGFIAVLFSIATYLKAQAAAVSGDRNSEHLTRQDHKLATIEYQMTEECIVKKAQAAGQHLLETARVEAAKLRDAAMAEAKAVLETARQTAAAMHSEARKVTGESQRAAAALTTAAAEIKQQASGANGDSGVLAKVDKDHPLPVVVVDGPS